MPSPLPDVATPSVLRRLLRRIREAGDACADIVDAVDIDVSPRALHRKVRIAADLALDTGELKGARLAEVAAFVGAYPAPPRMGRPPKEGKSDEITITVPPGMRDDIDVVVKEVGGTRSEWIVSLIHRELRGLPSGMVVFSKQGTPWL